MSYDRRSRTRSVSLLVVAVLMAGWSGLAWLGYAMSDPILAWTAGVATIVVDGGSGVAETLGGKEAGQAVKLVSSSGFVAQAQALLSMILKPLIVIAWGLGMLALFMLPLLITFASRIMGRSR